MTADWAAASVQPIELLRVEIAESRQNLKMHQARLSRAGSASGISSRSTLTSDSIRSMQRCISSYVLAAPLTSTT